MPQVTEGAVKDAELIGSWFFVQLDNGITGFFTDASGFSVEVEVVDIVETKNDTRSHKRPGQAKYGDITLKRKFSADKQFWNWAKSIREGKLEYRTSGSLVMADMAGKELVRWTFTNVWPSKWSVSDLDVGSDDALTEEVTLSSEHLVRVK